MEVVHEVTAAGFPTVIIWVGKGRDLAAGETATQALCYLVAIKYDLLLSLSLDFFRQPLSVCGHSLVGVELVVIDVKGSLFDAH